MTTRPHLTDRPRRSALFMPASNARAIEKARTIPADTIILDLEDAVAPEAKDAARDAAVAAINAGGFGDRELVIRVNGLDTPWGAADLAAVAGSAADAVLVPKVAAPQDIDAVDALLVGAAPGLALWAMVETCGAFLRLDAIAARATDTRLAAFVVGTNDLAREMRAYPAADRATLLPMLTTAVMAARAHGLAVLDGVCNEFRDLAVFAAEAAQGAALGFDGKSLIHPDQVAPANTAYAPSPAEIAEAQALVAAFAAPENAGKGAIRHAGRMVELLHRDEALRLLAFAARVGLD